MSNCVCCVLPDQPYLCCFSQEKENIFLHLVNYQNTDGSPPKKRVNESIDDKKSRNSEREISNIDFETCVPCKHSQSKSKPRSRRKKKNHDTSCEGARPSHSLKQTCSSDESSVAHQPSPSDSSCYYCCAEPVDSNFYDCQECKKKPRRRKKQRAKKCPSGRDCEAEVGSREDPCRDQGKPCKKKGGLFRWCKCKKKPKKVKQSPPKKVKQSPQNKRQSLETESCCLECKCSCQYVHSQPIDKEKSQPKRTNAPCKMCCEKSRERKWS